MNNINSPSLSNLPVPLQTQTVEISISTVYIRDLLSFLLTRNISFEMSYEVKNLSEKPLEQPLNSPKAKPENNNVLGSSSLNSQMQSVMEAIYQKYICDNIVQIPPNETIIAEEYHLQVATFKKNFKTCYGKPFYQLYMDKRMEYAAQLLKKGYKCNDVALMVGYGEKSAIKFNKMFQKHYGITPKKYQMSRDQ